jgi:RNA recognition motif-containing protein
MQETLNKMVSSVRHGVMVPRLASQTIHECAAMLGLPLVAELDETSIVVAGMRKTATKLDLVAGFKEFGEIDDAAVSSNARGFGLVRFESRKAAQRALAKFRQTEIVVQDVAVTIKILSSEDSGRPVNGPLLTR